MGGGKTWSCAVCIASGGNVRYVCDAVATTSVKILPGDESVHARRVLVGRRLHEGKCALNSSHGKERGGVAKEGNDRRKTGGQEGL